MTIQKINPRNLLLVLFILVVAALRLATSFSSDLSPMAVYTPLGAMAIFGGAYFSGNVKPFAFPLLTLFVSDLVLSFTVLAPYRSGLLYNGWFWTYAAFALMTVAGKLIIKKVTIKNIIIAVITATLIHWLISDIGGCLKENSSAFLTVYFERLGAAIPYELRFLAGTAVYSALMFGLFEWIKTRNYGLRGAYIESK